MPRMWSHELSKQQLESLASQLGVSTKGTLDDLRKRVRDKWTTIEPYLPPQASAKSFQTMNPIQRSTEPTSHLDAPVNKMKIKLVTDLIAAIPTLRSAKLDLKWSVPMRLARFVSPITVLLAKPYSGVTVRKAHVSQLKRHLPLG
ncbi:hypothetical protein B7P43_G14188 [Cryptotermes secundus]|uniref:SAP domain-containing protein n=1 Tax=Cryptotermes secundus TaxID=105785 RepID=A0A2J7PE02_9NEOP|nr:hypothetical protein B7P43_G14188 [Cryptotermes secundus]